MPVIPPTSARPRQVLLVGLLLLAWFVAFTGARPLNVPDEGRYAEVAREMLVSGDWVTPRLNGVPFLDKPPLFSWTEAAGFAIFGVHTWTARLAPALMAALGCLFVLLAGARLHGWRAGLLGAVILAANPYYFGASQYVNHDLAVAVWISGALLAFAVALSSDGPARPALVVAGCAAAGLAVLTKGLIGVVFPFGFIGLWVLLTWRWSRVPWLALGAGLLVLAALVVPWVTAVQAANPDFLHYFFVTQHFERFTGRGFNNPMGPGFYLVVLAAGLLPWTPLLPSALRRAAAAFRADRADHGAELLLLLWPALVVLFFSIPRSKIAGYALPALPPLAMLLGVWWDRALERPDGRRRAIAVSGWIMAGIAAALLLVPPLLPDRVPMAPAATAWLAATGLGALAASGLVLWAHRAGRMRLALAGHVAFAAIFGAGALLSVPHLVKDGTGSLAGIIRPLLREGDRVVCYRRYFYDLPVHLDRREPLVVVDDWDDPEIPHQDNWRRELWLGLRWRPEAAAWMISPERYRSLCGPGARCFTLVRRADAAELDSLGLVQLGEAGDALLLATPAAARAAGRAGDGGPGGPLHSRRIQLTGALYPDKTRPPWTTSPPTPPSPTITWSPPGRSPTCWPAPRPGWSATRAPGCWSSTSRPAGRSTSTSGGAWSRCWPARCRRRLRPGRVALGSAWWDARSRSCRATGSGWSSSRAGSRPRCGGWSTRRGSASRTASGPARCATPPAGS